MTQKRLSRRDFLKMSAFTVGGAATTLVGVPFLFKEEAVFDPNDSYWAEAKPKANSPLAENLQVDVAIIGGGYTGLATAYHLAKMNPNLKIIILEAKSVGHGASGRNGGMVLPQTGPETMQIDYDEETHKWTYDLTVKSMKELARLVEKSGMDCDLKLDGYIYAILKEEDLPYYQSYVAKARKMGIPLRYLNQAECTRELGTDIYVGAVYDPNGGSVHAMKLIRILKKEVEELGVVIYENSQVFEIEEGENVELVVGDSQFQVLAKDIVLAMNAYTSKLGYFKYELIPVHTQIAATAPLSKKQLTEIHWDSRLPFYDSRNFLYHLVLTPDNRILIGGGFADYYFNNELEFKGDMSAISDRMRKELGRIYPVLKNITFEYIWDGILGVTYDEYESVGVMGDYKNIYYALAYNGHGVNLSFMFGGVIANMLNGHGHGWQYTSYADYPLRKIVPPEPLKWLGAKGFLGYYQWLDGSSLS